jgi:hypothetical protein
LLISSFVKLSYFFFGLPFCQTKVKEALQHNTETPPAQETKQKQQPSDDFNKTKTLRLYKEDMQQHIAKLQG